MTKSDAKRRIGVRRIADVASANNYQHHGGNFFGDGGKHPLIAHLLEHNPRVLGKVLLTRESLRVAPYITQLLLSSEQRPSLRTGRTPQKIQPRRTSKRKAVVLQPSRKRQRLSKDIINEDDQMFLCDIIEEECKLSFRISAKLMEESPIGKFTATSKDVSKGHLYDNDPQSLLLWLSDEIKNNWNSFVKRVDVGCVRRALTFSDEEDCGSLKDEDAFQQEPSSALFKASMRIAGRTACDLGTYRTEEEAAKAYNQGVIARRFIGIKLLEENHLTRTVKARKADYEKMKVNETFFFIVCILNNHRNQQPDKHSIICIYIFHQRVVLENCVSPHDASKYTGTAASRAYDKCAKPNIFFTSNEVISPDLNIINGCSSLRDFAIAKNQTFQGSLANLLGTPTRMKDIPYECIILEEIVDSVLVGSKTCYFPPLLTAGATANTIDTANTSRDITEIDACIALLESKSSLLSTSIFARTENLAKLVIESKKSKIST